MIDIHCHILPAFDDGSTGMAESLAMARMAVSSGVTGIVTTPHFPGEPASLWRLKPLLERFQLLESTLKQEGIPLQLHLGAEILCMPQTTVMAERHALPTIGDTDYLLTEFDFGETGAYMTGMLEMLIANGYKPVVAHPERYTAVQQNPQLCLHWFQRMGCILQMNKGSLLGAFGTRVQNTAHFLIDRGLVHLIASDAHGADRRTPHMDQIRQWTQERCGRDYAWILLERNPARLIENRPMVPISYNNFPSEI